MNETRPRDEAASPRKPGASLEPELLAREVEGMVRLLERLERAMEVELGSLRAGTEPLLEELRQGSRALAPGPGGTRLSPKERDAWCLRLVKALDVLEDVLEGLWLASRANAGGRRV